MQDIVILGAGGHARETLDVLQAVNADGRRYHVVGFLDDVPERHGTELRGHPVLGGHEWLLAREHADVRYVVGIGSGRAKAALTRRLDAAGRVAAVLVHPDARVAHGAELGPGVILTAGVLLGCDVRLGAHTYVNLGASVSHDCVVGAYCHLAPGVRLAGNVRVGDGCELGIGAVAMPGVEVGAWSLIGAGAAVVRAIPAGVIAAGVPARVLRDRP
ncbi:MAG TPA: acetyltransferase [Gemmatirosa sp.]|nr:acetyltransferase [Gemmatirosa sp.]